MPIEPIVDVGTCLAVAVGGWIASFFAGMRFAQSTGKPPTPVGSHAAQSQTTAHGLAQHSLGPSLWLDHGAQFWKVGALWFLPNVGFHNLFDGKTEREVVEQQLGHDAHWGDGDVFHFNPVASTLNPAASAFVPSGNHDAVDEFLAHGPPPGLTRPEATASIFDVATDNVGFRFEPAAATDDVGSNGSDDGGDVAYDSRRYREAADYEGSDEDDADSGSTLSDTDDELQRLADTYGY